MSEKIQAAMENLGRAIVEEANEAIEQAKTAAVPAIGAAIAQMMAGMATTKVDITEWFKGAAKADEPDAAEKFKAENPDTGMWPESPSTPKYPDADGWGNAEPKMGVSFADATVPQKTAILSLRQLGWDDKAIASSLGLHISVVSRV
jgi:hypothetical protein